VAITGGPPVTLCAIHGVPGGATWSADGTIVFATELPGRGLQRLAATGGELTVLTRPDHVRAEGFHLWPEFLPGGTAVLYTILPDDGTIDNAQVAVLDLRTGKSKVLIRGGSHGQYVSTRHLLYVLNGTLRAVAFDLAGLEVIGTPTPVLDGVLTSLLGAADVAVAPNGSLVYIPGGTSNGGRRTVVSVDRQGRASPLPGLVPNAYRSLRVSPDGSRLALATPDDVWIYGFTRATLRRLTTHPAPDRYPLWTPDGRRIVFTSTRAGYPELFWRPADGTGTDERLLTRAKDLVDLLPDGWTANGRQLLFTEVPTNIQAAIGQIAIERPSDATMLVRNEYTNSYPAVSPDGRWMAYTQAMSGRGEIFLDSYPELGARQQVSIDGGELPVWSRDGRQLFFMTPDGGKLCGVTVQSGTPLLVGPPQVLFEFQAILPSHGSRGYDIGPDGRFLIIRRDQTDAVRGQTSSLILVQNWFEELKRLVPVN
jgi:hypothetical protein